MSVSGRVFIIILRSISFSLILYSRFLITSSRMPFSSYSLTLLKIDYSLWIALRILIAWCRIVFLISLSLNNFCSLSGVIVHEFFDPLMTKLPTWISSPKAPSFLENRSQINTSQSWEEVMSTLGFRNWSTRKSIIAD